MCLYPKLIKNRKYVPNKKNKGRPPIATDKRVLYVPAGCGKCMECLRQRGNNWRTRLLEEIRETKQGHFVTFTFSTEALWDLRNGVYEDNGGEELEPYDLDNAIVTLGIRRFLERWRKKYGVSIKHWFTTELGHGETEHVHVHGMIWLNKYKGFEGLNRFYLEEQLKDIKNIWQYGGVYIGDFLNECTVNYCIKYTMKMDLEHKNYKPIILCSKGIGNRYTNRIDAEMNKYKPGQTRETYRTRQGNRVALPMYYRNKIYNEEEREKLWLEKLDKQIRFVDGVKIDVSKGHDTYYKILKEAREKNDRLGYGSPDDWNKAEYEMTRRKLIYEKRFEKFREGNTTAKAA